MLYALWSRERSSRYAPDRAQSAYPPNPIGHPRQMTPHTMAYPTSAEVGGCAYAHVRAEVGCMPWALASRERFMCPPAYCMPANLCPRTVGAMGMGQLI